MRGMSFFGNKLSGLGQVCGNGYGSGARIVVEIFSGTALSHHTIAA